MCNIFNERYVPIHIQIYEYFITLLFIIPQNNITAKQWFPIVKRGKC